MSTKPVRNPLRNSRLVKTTIIHLRRFAVWIIKAFAILLAKDMAKRIVGWLF